MIPSSKEEYDKLFNPDYERKMQLVVLGIQNAKKANAKKVKLIERIAERKRMETLKDILDL